MVARSVRKIDSTVVMPCLRIDRADMQYLAQEAEFRGIPRTELIRQTLHARAEAWRSGDDRPRCCRGRGCGRQRMAGYELCQECWAAAEPRVEAPAEPGTAEALAYARDYPGA